MSTQEGPVVSDSVRLHAKMVMASMVCRLPAPRYDAYRDRILRDLGLACRVDRVDLWRVFHAAEKAKAGSGPRAALAFFRTWEDAGFWVRDVLRGMGKEGETA